MRFIGILLPAMIISACNTTLTGPVTGREYRVDVGCTDDMQAYERQREEVVGKPAVVEKPEVKIECPASDTPAP